MARAVRARTRALALILIVCGSLAYTPSAFLNPSAHAAFPRGTSCRSQQPCWTRRDRQCTFETSVEARLTPQPRRWASSPFGGTCPLSATEGAGEETENEDTGGPAEIYVPTEALLDDPSHMERIMASIARLVPAVEPTEGVFKSAVSHHCAIRTSNISRAMKFYSLLGMNEAVRFKAENARCAFLEGAGMRLELIEVPASMEPEDKALDLAADMRSTGLNHIAFDIGPAIEAEGLDGIKGFLSELNRQSENAFGMSVRLVVSPYEQRIGQDIFDLAFIMDADGVLLELVHKKDTLDVEMPQAW